ncbi:MAG: prepilin-type N-terminal cleavage/methylation domain-containing protein [Candidatus Omnitrophota bacterium]|nr:MAG: prepilin-type N-terminal cleavage/methylation domain-containing protein [Candidatus Omnitrophota bacterium]
MFTKKSFTLVELLVVIIIVGILAAVSIPIFRGYIWKARFAEVYSVVGMIANGKRAYRVEHGTYEGIPSYPYYHCQAGNGIATGSTLVQQDLGIQVDNNCFFLYLAYPRDGDSSTNIYFKEPGYEWAWYYNYVTKTWYEYPVGDGGPAREYFTPPS